MTPKDEISHLIHQGEILRDQTIPVLSTGIHSNGASIIGDLFVKTVIPYGNKGMARKVGKMGQKIAKGNINAQLHSQGNRFLIECESKVRQMSMITKNLSASGNSYRLLQKFNRVRRIKNPISFIDNTLVVLQELQNLELIWNKEIPKELTTRKVIAEIEKRKRTILQNKSRDITRKAQTVKPFDRSSITDQLKHYPQTQQSILGALDQLQKNAPDTERHCIISCRIAIESLCIELGVNNDWKKALNNIFTSDTDRRQVKNIWNYLSGKGAHGGHNPTKKEAEYCLRLTLATINFIIIGENLNGNLLTG